MNIRIFVAGLLAVLMAACGSSGGGGGGGTGPNVSEFPNVEISPAEVCEKAGEALKKCKLTLDQGSVAPGDVLESYITIKNSGERAMEIQDIQLAYIPPTEGENPPAFAIELPPAYAAAIASDTKFYVSPVGKGTPEEPEQLAIKVTFYRYNDEEDRTAKLLIDTDAANMKEGKVYVDIFTSAGAPKLQVAPEFVQFAQVGMGETADEKLNVLNTGTSDLTIDGFKFIPISGGEYFTLIVQGTEYPISQVPADGVSFPEKIVVAPQSATFFKVRFAPEDDKPASAKLVIFSNDPDYAGTETEEDGKEVKISGNESVPCIAVNPEKVNFGGKMYGQVAVAPLEISACGEAPLEIYGITIVEGSHTDFGVDLSTLDHGPEPANPVIVPINGTVIVNVTFSPETVSPVDGSGNIILSTGMIQISNNSFEKEKQVELSGAGVKVECPTALIKVAEGDEVIPQTILHLYGDESYASNGTIQKWEWTVEQPVGSAAVFVPSFTFPNPTFEANVAGVYKFYLTVYDQTNTPSCFPAQYEVVVIPDEAIHIELLWDTPEDPDETDTGPEAGSDLDLHFLHPWAAGPDLDGDGAPDGWFDIPFDSFWFNAHPNWGSYDPAINDDPGLDRDDTDGAGPENINLDIPENVVYRVGVHYWNDHGYGPAYATVRVYIYAQLVFEVTDVMLIDSDMWAVCNVEWPSGKVQVVTDPIHGGYKITPNYQNPYFFQ